MKHRIGEDGIIFEEKPTFLERIMDYKPIKVGAAILAIAGLTVGGFYTSKRYEESQFKQAEYQLKEIPLLILQNKAYDAGQNLESVQEYLESTRRVNNDRNNNLIWISDDKLKDLETQISNSTRLVKEAREKEKSAITW